MKNRFLNSLNFKGSSTGKINCPYEKLKRKATVFITCV